MNLDLFFAIAILIILAAVALFVVLDQHSKRALTRAMAVQAEVLDNVFGFDDDDTDVADEAFKSSPVGSPRPLLDN